MKKIIFLCAFVVVLFIIEFWLGFLHQRIHPTKITRVQPTQNIKITSSVFQNNQLIPKIYTCDGLNVNPPLSLSNIPSNAKSLVLIVQDPDAVGGLYYHWIVYNISPAVTDILRNSVPENSEQAITSSGKPGYEGPCPPSGMHRYEFKIYVLDTLLASIRNATITYINQSIQGHIIEQAELIGLYRK